MATQSVNVNAMIVDHPRDDGDNSDCFILFTPLSSRGLTKHDAISVENYDRERHLHMIRFNSSHKTTVKSESPPIYIDLDQYSDEDDVTLTFDCDICVELKPIIESFRISGCSHLYCNDCVSKYIAAKLQDNVLSVQCPVSGCSGRLEPDHCRQILPKEVFDRWGDALCEALVMRSKRFYCPYKDCSALVFLDECKKKMKESECPHCHRKVCVACGTKWHSEISCKEFQKLGENERGRDDILLRKMAKSKRWRRCPSCRSYIAKSGGCSHMLCRCGFQFCYKCGKSYDQDHSHSTC